MKSRESCHLELCMKHLHGTSFKKPKRTAGSTSVHGLCKTESLQHLCIAAPGSCLLFFFFNVKHMFYLNLFTLVDVISCQMIHEVIYLFPEFYYNILLFFIIFASAEQSFYYYY